MKKRGIPGTRALARVAAHCTSSTAFYIKGAYILDKDA